MVDISIIIPTFNRHELLRECLLALDKQQMVDMSRVEVIVVENGLRSGAEEVVTELASHYESLLYKFEPLSGVSRARNIGVACSCGDLLVFLDDDELPEPAWLYEITRLLLCDSDRVDIVSGENEPLWGAPRPDWLVDDLLKSYSVKARWSAELKLMEKHEWVFEGNCAVRAQLLREAGGFNEAFGRKDSSLMSGEGQVYSRLRNQGAVAVFNPKAVVFHHISPEQLSVDWLFRRWFSQGREDALSSDNPPAWYTSLRGSALRLDAFANQPINGLSTGQVELGINLYRALGFICQKQGVV